MGTPDLHTIPDLADSAAHFRLIRDEAERLTASLSDARFNWKPAPDQWSVGQCLEHLNVLGYMLLPRLEEAVNRTREAGATRSRPVKLGLGGRLFVKFNAPVFNRKVKTPPPYVPSTSGLDKADVVARFLILQNRLIRLAEDAADLDLNRVKVSSPALKLLRLNVPAWIITTNAHEARHLLQASRILQAPGFPTA